MINVCKLWFRIGLNCIWWFWFYICWHMNCCVESTPNIIAGRWFNHMRVLHLPIRRHATFRTILQHWIIISVSSSRRAVLLVLVVEIVCHCRFGDIPWGWHTKSASVTSCILSDNTRLRLSINLEYHVECRIHVLWSKCIALVVIHSWLLLELLRWDHWKLICVWMISFHLCLYSS